VKRQISRGTRFGVFAFGACKILATMNTGLRKRNLIFAQNFRNRIRKPLNIVVTANTKRALGAVILQTKP